MSSDRKRRPTQSRLGNSPPQKRTRQDEPERNESRDPSTDRRGSEARGYAANRGGYDSPSTPAAGSSSRTPATRIRNTDRRNSDHHPIERGSRDSEDRPVRRSSSIADNTSSVISSRILPSRATASVSIASRGPGMMPKPVLNKPASEVRAPDQMRKPPDFATMRSKLDDMRQLRLKKQTLANEQSNDHGADTPTQLDQAQLKSQQNDIQESQQERARFEIRIQQLESQQNDIQELKTEREQLAQRVRDLEAERADILKLKDDHAQLVSQVERLLHSDISRLDEANNQLIGRVQTLETQSSQHEKLKEKVDNLEIPVKKVSEDLNKLKLDLNNIERDALTRQPVSNLGHFEEKLERLRKALQEVQQSVREHGSDIKNLLSSVGSVVLEILAPYENGVNERLDKIKDIPSQEELQKLVEQNVSQQLAKIDSLHTSMKHDLEKLRGDVDSTSLCVDTKANTMEVREEIKNLRHSFKVLDHQYNNLHTQDLHNRIVQTLLRQTPQNAAALVQEVKRLNQEVQQMQRTIRNIPWLVTQQSDVQSLLASAPQLLALAQTNSDPRRGIEQNSRETQISAAAESSRLEGLIALERDYRLIERNEIASKFDREMSQLTQLLNGQTEGVPQMREKVKALEQLIDGINSKYITPNRHYFELLSRVILAVAQLQPAVLELRQHVQKLNGTRHDCRWTEDLHKYQLGSILAALQFEEDGGQDVNGEMAE